MNKRQRKKLDILLYKAIKELNENAAKSEGFKVDYYAIQCIFESIRKCPKSTNRTIKDYKKLIE